MPCRPTCLSVGTAVGGEHVEPEERVPDEGKRGSVVARATWVCGCGCGCEWVNGWVRRGRAAAL